MLTIKRLLFAAVLLTLGGAVAWASLRAPARRPVSARFFPDPSQQVAAAELAGWMVEGRRDFTLVDLRPREAYERKRIPGAVSCATCHASRAQGRLALEQVDVGRKVVLYTQSGTETASLPPFLATGRDVMWLTGGCDAFEREVLAPVRLEGLATEDAVAAARRRAAVRSFFTGEGMEDLAASRRTLPPEAVVPHRKPGGCEGC
jgi:rhodanese-related sulfurtransferase